MKKPNPNLQMMNEVKEKLSQWNPRLKETSLNQYADKLRKIRQDVKEDSFDFFLNADEMVKYMEEKHSNESTRKAYLNVIISYMIASSMDESKIDIYRKPRDILNDNYMNQQLSGELVESQKKKFVSMDIVNQLIDKMSIDLSEEPKTIMEHNLWKSHLIFKTHTILPLRNEVGTLIVMSPSKMKLLDKDYIKKNNFLMMGKGAKITSIVLNDYKTDHLYDTKTIPFPESLNKVYKRYMKKFKIKTGMPLINWTRAQQSSNLTNISRRYINVPLSSQMLRHIYLTDKYGKVKLEMMEDASVSGHSTNTQNVIYIKNPADFITEL